MPLYEYKCRECATIFTELRRISDENPPRCPRCNSISTDRKISTFSSVRPSQGCGTTGGG